MNRRDEPARRYRLQGRIGSEDRSYVVPPGESWVGSSAESDLMIAQLGVSRRHARLGLDGERLEIEDRDSRNGTFVNGKRIERRVLRCGDKIRFGPAELTLDVIDAGDAELAVVLLARAETPLPQGVDQTTATAVGSWRPEGPREALCDLVWPPGYVRGRSAAMRRFYREVESLVAADLPILIEGETGVGKESVVRILHASSQRCHRPLVAVNCAAIPADLLEAEMFGIGEGVATGVRGRRGKFLQAHGGWLFLDEIAELGLELQAKLLRVLQEREVQPVGGTATPVDVRLVAASNVDLLAKVVQGRFRRDLYYRVAGIVLTVPPLRERAEDIPLLVEHFLSAAAESAGKSIRGMTVKALEMLSGATWHGNVRELEHEVKRLVYLCADGQAIDSTLLADRPLSGREPVSPPAAPRLADQVREAERLAILDALERGGGSQRQAAKLLGIARTTLARKIREYAIRT